jgi:hypothetical protein
MLLYVKAIMIASIEGHPTEPAFELLAFVGQRVTLKRRLKGIGLLTALKAAFEFLLGAFPL